MNRHYGLGEDQKKVLDPFSSRDGSLGWLGDDPEEDKKKAAIIHSKARLGLTLFILGFILQLSDSVLSANLKLNINHIDFGLALIVVGTLLTAFSVGGHSDNPGYYEDDNGREFPFAYVLHPVAFRMGLGLIILGTGFQLSLFS